GLRVLKEKSGEMRQVLRQRIGGSAAAQHDRALRAPEQSHREPEQGGFPGAIAAEDGDALTGLCGERKIVKDGCGGAGIAEAHLLHSERRRAYGFHRAIASSKSSG